MLPGPAFPIRSTAIPSSTLCPVCSTLGYMENLLGKLLHATTNDNRAFTTASRRIIYPPTPAYPSKSN